MRAVSRRWHTGFIVGVGYWADARVALVRLVVRGLPLLRRLRGVLLLEMLFMCQPNTRAGAVADST